MLRRIALPLAIMLSFCFPVWGQNKSPMAEVFAGFSFLSVSDGTALGWETSVAGNVHRNIGLVADFGGQYKSLDGATFQSYEFLFGPQVNLRTGPATPFVHVLFGGSHVRAGSASNTGFMMGIGGGVDVNSTDRIAVRILQVDWLPNRFEGEWSKSEYRVSLGVVFKVGR